MSRYIVITENDESDWSDQTGVVYHYPPRYKKLIEPGVKVLYYKGKLVNNLYKSKRLSSLQHYFGIGKIGKVWRDENSKNYFASIEDFRLFDEAVYFKNESGYLEKLANGLKYNYFKGNGVRPLTEDEYNTIVQLAHLKNPVLTSAEEEFEVSHTTMAPEGKQIQYYVTKYERVKVYRDKAIKIHGYSCIVCGINFKEKYGILGEGYIHIHHVRPLHSLTEEVIPDPKSDLVPVCPNCHAMLHRKKGVIVSVDELKEIIEATKKK